MATRDPLIGAIVGGGRPDAAKGLLAEHRADCHALPGHNKPATGLPATGLRAERQRSRRLFRRELRSSMQKPHSQMRVFIRSPSAIHDVPAWRRAWRQSAPPPLAGHSPTWLRVMALRQTAVARTERADYRTTHPERPTLIS